MTKYLTLLFAVLLAIASGSCREDFDYRSSAGELRFSRDTVYLDTVFNSLSSSTYNLRVYNTTNDDISIPSVYLEQGENSGFRLNVNGRAGKSFSNVEIPAKDSIFVFIESTFDLTNFTAETFLATDAIVFGDNETRQNVQLITLVRDATFLYPERIGGIKETLPIGTDESGEPVYIEGFELDDTELVFTNEKPYVIYGYAAVPSGKTLEIQAGARVHFHEASGILVQEGGQIHINGTESSESSPLENEVIFEGDRLEPEFSDVPGQWGTIWIAEGSTGNTIEHLTVKNAIVGLLLEGDATTSLPKLSVRNSRFLNSSNINILARNSKLEATNSIAGSAGQVSLYLTEGGHYTLTHCTIANFWNTGLRNLPALLIDNYRLTESGEQTAFPLRQANFINSVITGNTQVEFILERDPGQEFSVSFSNSLLQFDTNSETLLSNPLYDFSNSALYSNIVLNGTPGFLDAATGKFELTQQSEAIDIGDPAILGQVPQDILGLTRDNLPDAGAYEYIPTN